jgi:hypothetical protein
MHQQASVLQSMSFSNNYVLGSVQFALEEDSRRKTLFIIIKKVTIVPPKGNLYMHKRLVYITCLGDKYISCCSV